MKISHRTLLAAFLSATLMGSAVGPISVARAADPDTTIPKVVLPSPNGFDSLVLAGKAYIPGVEGAPADTRKMAFDENLAGQRQSVSRNQKVLKLAREGLAQQILNPPSGAATVKPNYDQLRSVARLFKQEWGLKITANDWVGALSSQLDAVEMGVAITRGGGIDALETGLGIENMGRANMALVASHLSPPECLQAVTRLQKIEALRPSLADVMRVEESSALTFTRYSLESRDWEDVITGVPDPKFAPPPPKPSNNGGGGGGEGEGAMMAGGAMMGEGGIGQAPPPPPLKSPFKPNEIDQLRTLGLSELSTNVARIFETLRANVSAPFGTQKATVSPASDPWSRYLSNGLSDPLIRISYENARTQNLLWMQSFTLAAARTIAGQYPATFDAPRDPFRPAQPLVYKIVGGKYLLYSVGPDGKDDGGTPATTTSFIRDDDAGAVAGGLEVKTTGDLMATVF